MQKVQTYSLRSFAIILIAIFITYSGVPIAFDQGEIFVWPFKYLYWDQFDYQIFISIFCGLLTKFFSCSGAVTIFRIINLVMMVYAVRALGKITSILFENDKITIIYYIIVPFCVPFTFFVSWAYGNIPSICIMIFAILQLLLFFQEHKWSQVIKILIFALFGFLFKLSAEIIIIAMIIIIFLKVFETLQKTLYKKYITLIMGLFFIIICVPYIMIFIGNNLQSEYKITKFPSKINFVQGLNAFDEKDKIDYKNLQIENPKIYTVDAEDLIGKWSSLISGETMTLKYDDESARIRTDERLKYRIHEFITNPNIAVRYFFRKQVVDWNSPDFSAITNWGLANYIRSDYYQESEYTLKIIGLFAKDQIGYNIVYNFADGYQTLIYLSILICSVCVFRNIKIKTSKLRLEYYIIPLSFLGQFYLSFVAESGGRFNFHVFILILPYAAFGILKLQNYITHKTTN
ncbi:MAG: hypothetical protein LBN03_02955 [Bifidobacteriaceae bacterium]|nr:hypothetical protein [Bifidobacteriaceae bacterium]